MKFIYYDIGLMILFVLFVARFLYKNRKNLQKDGLLYLYRTKWGMNLIDKVGKKYKKTLHFLSYVSIIIGYFLMGGMIWLFGKMVYLYVAYPNIVRAIKIPPIMPLVPYLPQAFKLNFLPDFYFITWILVLAVIAITHEFSHGIFMRRYGIKVKSTGFGFFPFFFPIFLAAFVEQDEKSMNKSKNFHQMAVLSAGTFANILTTVFFFIIMILFFSLSFAPSGIQFNTYSYSILNTNQINFINGIEVHNLNYSSILDSLNETGYNEIKTSNGNYLATKDFLINQKADSLKIALYDDSPAIRAELKGSIIQVNGEKIKDWDDFAEIISEKSPGENITLTSLVDEEEVNYEITLGENLEDPEKSWVGIGYAETERSGVIGKLVTSISSFKKEHLYYAPKYEAAVFIYNLLWWLVLISFSVALVNMLPVGIFDGGRFFYLTILGITKSEKKAERWYKGITYAFLFLLAVLMVFWGLSFFK